MLRPALVALARGALAATFSQPGAAHEGHKAEGAQGGRYQLTRYTPGVVVEVVDRSAGRIYVLEVQKKRALMIDVGEGATLTKALDEEVVKADAKGGAPAWPGRVAVAEPARYAFLKAGRAGIEAGGQAALFDGIHGRVIVVDTPGSLVILDPVEGKRVRRALRTRDETGLLKEIAAKRQPTAARRRLLEVVGAQRIFRTLKTPPRYGTLEELVEAKLLPAEVLRPVQGYQLLLSVDKKAPGERFLACANPSGEAPPQGVAREAYVLSERGDLYAREAPITPAELAAGSVPSDAERRTAEGQ